MTLSKARTRKNAQAEKKREMPLRGDGQAYARVTKMLGNGRLLATCSDGAERLCIIRGSMRKREWVRVGDTVLVALRDFQDGKADIVFKYLDTEVHRLRTLGEDVVLPNAQEDGDEDEAAVHFEHDPEDNSWLDAI